MTWTEFYRQLRAAHPEVHEAWQTIQGQPRALLDAASSEWEQIDIGTKLDVVHQLARHSLLDPLLQTYIVHYRRHHPHVLDGLGLAIVEYATAGYHLHLPASPLIGPIHHPGYVASLARLLEDHQLECGQYHWLVLELRRLRQALDAWMAIHEGDYS